MGIEQTRRSGRISLALPLQMLAGLLIGLVLALVWPSFAIALQPIGTAFIEAIRMIIIPLLLNGLFHPGRGADLVPTGKIPANLAVSIDWVKFLLDLIPSNIVAAMASGKLLPTLVFSVLFGIALAGIGERAKPVVGL